MNDPDWLSNYLIESENGQDKEKSDNNIFKSPSSVKPKKNIAKLASRLDKENFVMKSPAFTQQQSQNTPFFLASRKARLLAETRLPRSPRSMTGKAPQFQVTATPKTMKPSKLSKEIEACDTPLRNGTLPAEAKELSVSFLERLKTPRVKDTPSNKVGSISKLFNKLKSPKGLNSEKEDMANYIDFLPSSVRRTPRTLNFEAPRLPGSSKWKVDNSWEPMKSEEQNDDMVEIDSRDIYSSLFPSWQQRISQTPGNLVDYNRDAPMDFLEVRPHNDEQLMRDSIVIASPLPNPQRKLKLKLSKIKSKTNQRKKKMEENISKSKLKDKDAFLKLPFTTKLNSIQDFKSRFDFYHSIKKSDLVKLLLGYEETSNSSVTVRVTGVDITLPKFYENVHAVRSKLTFKQSFVTIKQSVVDFQLAKKTDKFDIEKALLTLENDSFTLPLNIPKSFLLVQDTDCSSGLFAQMFKCLSCKAKYHENNEALCRFMWFRTAILNKDKNLEPLAFFLSPKESISTIDELSKLLTTKEESPSAQETSAGDVKQLQDYNLSQYQKYIFSLIIPSFLPIIKEKMKRIQGKTSFYRPLDICQECEDCHQELFCVYMFCVHCGTIQCDECSLYDSGCLSKKSKHVPSDFIQVHQTPTSKLALLNDFLELFKVDNGRVKKSFSLKEFSISKLDQKTFQSSWIRKSIIKINDLKLKEDWSCKSFINLLNDQMVTLEHKRSAIKKTIKFSDITSLGKYKIKDPLFNSLFPHSFPNHYADLLNSLSFLSELYLNRTSPLNLFSDASLTGFNYPNHIELEFINKDTICNLHISPFDQVMVALSAENKRETLGTFYIYQYEDYHRLEAFFKQYLRINKAVLNEETFLTEKDMDAVMQNTKISPVIVNLKVGQALFIPACSVWQFSGQQSGVQSRFNLFTAEHVKTRLEYTESGLDYRHAEGEFPFRRFLMAHIMNVLDK